MPALATSSFQTLPTQNVIDLFDRLLIDAIQAKASDLHIEPQSKDCRIRLRIDGVLHLHQHLPAQLIAPLASRIKVLANLDITERRLPQDGHGLYTYQSCQYHLRISCCPMLFGEKIVIRIFDPNLQAPKLSSLGFTPAQRRTLRYHFNQSGLILMIGPTGSGKTTTAYSMLQAVNRIDKNILTCEDPIEIYLPGLNQLQIQPDIQRTFHQSLRSFLRQDPDLILIGEIRDTETAKMASNAAHTGHLVFATMHASHPLDSFYRLQSLGLDWQTIASCLRLVINQRLVKRLCQYCKKQSHQQGVYLPQGCSKCKQGFQGRIGIFELLPLTRSLQRAISLSHSTWKIQQKIKQNVNLSLKQSALEKVHSGLTSIQACQQFITH